MAHASATSPRSTAPALAPRHGTAAVDPEALHPALWHAHQLGRHPGGARPTGFAALDAELPGGGWPAGALTELLLPHAGLGELRLLAPALAAVSGAGRSVVWFDPPAQPCAATLQALGIDTARLLLVHGRDGLRGRARALLPAADVLWALEQTLRSAQVGAVVAWLPSRLRADVLRRLQLAAQAHDGPVFVLRDLEARLQPSPAPLRLALAAAGADRLAVRVLKRRGPPRAQPLSLMLAPVLSPTARARAVQPRQAAPVAAAAAAGPADVLA